MHELGGGLRVCMSVCVCVYVCVWGGGREEINPYSSRFMICTYVPHLIRVHTTFPGEIQRLQKGKQKRDK